MPTILQVNAVSNFGSTGKIMENIGNTALKCGWKSYVAHGGRYSLKSTHQSFLISSISKNRIAALHTLLTDRHGYALAKETNRFIKWVESIKPDIIHLHNIHSYYLNIKVLFEYLSTKEIPIVWTLHDCWAFTGHCSHFVSINCQKWKNGCHNCLLSHKFPKSLFRDQSKRNYADKKRLFTAPRQLTIVTVSEWLGNLAKESFLSKYPVKVINNGIDLKSFTPQTSSALRERNNLENKFILLGVSTDWCKAKGLEDYVRLREMLPEHYQIVLIGMRQEQIKKYRQLGLICLPRTENINELAEWYSTADVVTNLSYAETFGLPIVEGFACGTPAIVYNDTALPELITSETGLLVEPGDLQGVVEAVQRIEKLGKNLFSPHCIARAREKYDKERNYERYIDLYESMMNKN